MNLRDGLLQEIDALVGCRDKLLALADKHVETIIPAYTDRKSTRLNSSHIPLSRMPSSA